MRIKKRMCAWRYKKKILLLHLLLHHFIIISSLFIFTAVVVHCSCTFLSFFVDIAVVVVVIALDFFFLKIEHSRVGKISKELAQQQKKRELQKIHAYFWYLSIAIRENNWAIFMWRGEIESGLYWKLGKWWLLINN